MPKTNISTTISTEIFKSLKKLAIDLGKPYNFLLEEAIKELLAKHKGE